MLSKQDKQKLRGSIFRHLDGIATATSAFALHKKGVLPYLLKEKKVSLDTLTSEFKANEGYLNVALRVLCSQGWLTQHLDNSTNSVSYETTDLSTQAFQLVPHYEEAVNLLKYTVKLSNEPIGIDAFHILEKVFVSFESQYGMDVLNEASVEYQILKHIEGVIIAPIIVRLGMNGLFHKYFMEASFTAEEYHKNPESFKKILDFFAHLGWFNKKKNTYQFTNEGLFFAKRASAYGVTVSYLPTFIHLDELIFGNAHILKTSSPDETEKHVHREMNVWGSG
ncbi:MAG: class I SAM-dependent methyltransferase, partial [Psychroserpens sp.]|nr:class I SAM-dependent methyltransferase [Psychroserpens sp.]